ncbi:MAG: prephenate dehydrogenase/arogenate dehydrogenase family protein [Candidatus Puniceispirillales bacterium]|jgi:cyclohexadieny/prephenate dehydrogenase|tara:strand:+ start:1409 stop:2287 length:879 start_codon:yes stop_codon:yes gene_type:complete
MALVFKKISVIGLGLIGTSILHAINAKEDKDIVTLAYDINPDHRDVVLKMNIASFVFSKIEDAIKDADLIILSIPVGSMSDVAKLIAPFLKKYAVITDTGSTKQSVIKDVTPHLPNNVYFIPSHPLAGTEYSGPKSGFGTLFENRYWLIISDKETKQTKQLRSFFIKLGSLVETINMSYHDRILAITSHLPHLIAYTIVGTASDLETDLKNDVIKFSASGFRDFTRIASSDPIMWRDIFIHNSDAVLEMLQRFNEDLSDLQKAIRKKDGEKLHSFFSRTRLIRKKIIDAGQS